MDLNKLDFPPPPNELFAEMSGNIRTLYTVQKKVDLRCGIDHGNLRKESHCVAVAKHCNEMPSQTSVYG